MTIPPTLTKVLVYTGLIALAIAIGVILWQQHQVTVQQEAIQTQMVGMQQLQDNIVRSSSQWATKDDLAAFAKQNSLDLSTIQSDMEKLGAQLTAINEATVNSTGQIATNVPSSSSTPAPPNSQPPPQTVTCNGQQLPCPDPFGFLHNTQTLQLNEQFSDGTTIPFGSVGFSAWQEKPWQYTIQPREYDVTTTVGVDDQERETIYNKFSIKVANKSYDVKITNSKTLQQYPQASFSFWNPRLFMTAGGGLGVSSLPLTGSFNAGGTLGIMSYGQSKPNPSWSFLQLGASYQTDTHNVSLIVNPANYNIGALLPKGLVNNTYVGPSVQIDPSGNVMLGANISVGF
jgi:hypothetical protein